MQKTLSDMTLRTLPQGEFWDAKLTGFGVRVGKNGTTFLLNKGNRRVKLGTYPLLSLQEARRLALTLKADRTTIERSQTLGEALTLFYDTHCKHYRPKVIYETRGYMAKYAAYNGLKLTKLTTQLIHEVIDAQTTAQANKLFAVTRTFFRFCVRRRLIPHSPLEGLGMPHKTVSRARVLSDEELVRIWKVVQSGAIAAQVSSFNDSSRNDASAECPSLPVNFCRIVQLLILTGQRRGEIAGLRQNNIDFTNNLICLKPSQTKNAKEHSFPISALAISILKSRMNSVSTKPETLLFPARGQPENSFNGWSKSKAALDQASGVTDWTLHDIRRTVATRMAERSVPPHVIERILNHVSGGAVSGIAAVYNRASYLEEMRQAFDKYEQWLITILRT